MKPTSILSADWGTEAHKRAVFVADVNDQPIVRRVLRQEWTFAAVMKEAELLASKGPVLIALDVPLGLPSGFLDALRSAGAGAPTTFLDLLPATASWPRFFDASQHPRDWGVHRPFFSVPAGDGGLTSYLDAGDGSPHWSHFPLHHFRSQQQNACSRCNGMSVHDESEYAPRPTNPRYGACTLLRASATLCEC